MPYSILFIALMNIDATEKLLYSPLLTIAFILIDAVTGALKEAVSQGGMGPSQYGSTSVLPAYGMPTVPMQPYGMQATVLGPQQGMMTMSRPGSVIY